MPAPEKPQRTVCGAQRRKQPGQFCQQIALYPNGRCRLHGGASPSGPSHYSQRRVLPRTKRYIPAHLQFDFDAARADPNRYELSDQLALLDARFGELCRALDAEAADPGFRSLASKWADMERADRAGDLVLSGRIFAQIREGVMQAGRIERTWFAIYDLIERRRRLVESERKRMMETSQMLTLAQALSLLTTLQDAVFQHVHDAAAIDAIWATFQTLAGLDADRAGGPALPAPHGPPNGHQRPADGSGVV